MSNNESPFIEQRIVKVNGQVTIRRYKKLKLLGKGGFASCFLVESCQTQKQYAAKIVSKSILLKPKTKQKLLSEIRIHKSVSHNAHKNIVQFYHVFENEYEVFILLEVCSNKNMYELIKKRHKLTVPQVQYYIYQLVQALSYLHNNMIIHRDVKLGNLFINDRMELKLGDFGLATKLQFPGQRKRTVCGTPNYIAPEIIENMKGHSFQVDVWSTGVIMYIFLTGKPPFQTDNLEKTYKRIKAGDFVIPPSMNKDAADLLNRMLVVDPSKRATFNEVLAHAFMNPIGGIIKTLPSKSLTQVPNLKDGQKYSQQDMRLIKQASQTSIRSDIDYGLQRIQEESKDKPRSSSISRLFKSLLSPVAKMQRSNSSQLLKSSQQREFVNREKQQKNTSRSGINLKKKQVYVLNCKFDAVMSYALSNGMTGTCQSTYKLLYSKAHNIYFEITADNVKKVPGERINQQIMNRRKFLFSIKSQVEQQGELPATKDIIYVKRVLKTSQAIVFVLSSGINQLTFVDRDDILLVSGEDLLLLPKGSYDSMVKEKRQNVCQSKRIEIVKGYRIMMEILNKAQ